MSLKRDRKNQEEYQKYLEKVGINKNTMTYYQYTHSGDKDSKSADNKPSKQEAPLKRIKRHRQEEKEAIEEALSKEELKRLGYRG